MVKRKISIVIPCYNSEHTILKVFHELEEVLKEEVYEVVLVNDSSKDDTWNVIKTLASQQNNIVAVDFARNFGQHAALMAGFARVSGDIVVTMDDDGQAPIDSLLDLVDSINDETDVVFGEYIHKIQKRIYRRLGSWLDTKMCEILLNKPKNLYLSTFMVAKRYVIDECLKYDGSYPYIAGLVLRTTDKIVNIPVEQRNRIEGDTGYSLRKLVALWMNGFTTFSVKPLRIASVVGFATAIIGFVYGIILIIRKIVNPDIVVGYSSIVCSILFVGGIVMIMLGMVGEYLGRVYMSMNKAPQYAVRSIVDHRSLEEK